MAWDVDFGNPMMPRDSEGDEISKGSPGPEENAAHGPNGGGRNPAPGAQGGIPDAPEGNPTFDASAADDGTQRPLAQLPSADFWEVLYGRRSIRKFTDQPVDPELVDQVMHAGIWAPSSWQSRCSCVICASSRP